MTAIVGRVDPEFLDQGKQTKLGRILEWCGPTSLRHIGPRTRSGGKSVVKMRDRGDVPGVTRQGACEETASVIDEMGDDHFDDLERKVSGGGRACSRSLRRSICGDPFPDVDQTSVPNSINEQLNRCNET